MRSDGGRIFKICKQYLHHIQYSVFEGNISYSKLEELEVEITERAFEKRRFFDYF